ncbi:MAG TPA: hypothetical protein VGR06_02240 [Actinophytocola sp.]|uniref:hypothetical protein n=1 Tax=Actinophytocola sp. TaxID=1872138 RepID=UPI002E0230F6|nr:hypothetical protein [Actinophytocola sp.]
MRDHSRHGVIAVGTLAKLGVTPSTAYRRCVPNGPWQRPLPGIVVLHNAQPTRRQLIEAALLYAGTGAVVTGLEACRQHGLVRLPDEASVHLLLPADRKVISSAYVTIERTTRLPEPVIRDGLPLAPLVRSVLDACRRLRAFDTVGALITEAVQRRRIHPERLAHELSMGSRRGTSVPREVLRDIVGGARSVAELDAMRVWKRTGLPPLTWNCELFDAEGRFIACPDGWCGEVGLAWEIDSYEFHFGRTDYARTLARNTTYAANGITVVRTLPNRLRNEPDAVVAELLAAHRSAAVRPRPQVMTRRLNVR